MTASLSRFCDTCGAANTLQARECFACHEPLPTVAPSIEEIPVSRAPVPASSPVVQSCEPVRPGMLLLNRYRMVRELGQGGFGVVYLARDRARWNKRVAVKQITIGKLRARDVIDATDSYNREVSLLSKLRHKYLPRIYNHFTDAEHWYLVMNYIKGETLEQYLATAPHGVLPWKKALDIGIQLCSVLDYLHTQKPPIIFRDVKPANIMRTPQGRIYLIDFGIARRFSPERTKDTGPLGSPGYAAPEQYGLAQTTTHTDIYGLGATLQTLLTGQEPTEVPGNQAALMVQNPVPAKLQALLDQMLERDIWKRPKSIYEVKQRLERIRYGVWSLIRPYLMGMLIGFAPYMSLLILTLSPNAPSPFAALLCLLPFVFLGQFIAALIMLCSRGKRLKGLGILSGLALFVLLLSLPWTSQYFYAGFFY